MVNELAILELNDRVNKLEENGVHIVEALTIIKNYLILIDKDLTRIEEKLKITKEVEE